MYGTLFGDPYFWPKQDLVGISSDFSGPIVVQGYASGVFPMPLDEGRMGWWAPMQRGILPLGGLRVTRSLRQSARRYTTTVDADFDGVLARCADPSRDGGWIDERIVQAYGDLHDHGFAHSIETWSPDGELVGGLYGVHIRGFFAGESMFHDPDRGRDASKVALLRLVTELRAIGVVLLDVQWVTPHLATLGAVEMHRDQYLRSLSHALDVAPGPLGPGRPMTGRELAAAAG